MHEKYEFVLAIVVDCDIMIKSAGRVSKYAQDYRVGMKYYLQLISLAVIIPDYWCQHSTLLLLYTALHNANF